MWSGSRPRHSNSGRFCLFGAENRHTRAASLYQHPKKFWRSTSSFYYHHLLYEESLLFKIFSGIQRHVSAAVRLTLNAPPPPLSAHPITPKLHLIPVLSFLWAPSLKNSWGCAAAAWKYISQHATFHSEALGYELSCSIIQNELHPDLWAHAGRWGLVLSVLMGIICFWGEQHYPSKMVWTCPISTQFHCIYNLWTFPTFGCVRFPFFTLQPRRQSPF